MLKIKRCKEDEWRTKRFNQALLVPSAVKPGTSDFFHKGGEGEFEKSTSDT